MGTHPALKKTLMIKSVLIAIISYCVTIYGILFLQISKACLFLSLVIMGFSSNVSASNKKAFSICTLKLSSGVLNVSSTYKDAQEAQGGSLHIYRPDGSSEEYARTNNGYKDLFRRDLYPESMLSLDFLRNKKILDAGTGGGKLVFDLSKLGMNVVGIDLALTLEQANSPDLFTQADMTEIPFPDGTFDIVFSTYSLFYYRSFRNHDPRLDVLVDKALQELARVMKPGAVALISPFDNYNNIDEQIAKVPQLRKRRVYGYEKGVILERIQP